MFKHLIQIKPLGFMYGSAGGFLNTDNLVGRSGSKFPPDAATLSGLIFGINNELPPTKKHDKGDLKYNLYTAGPFWAYDAAPELFYVPIPWHKIIDETQCDTWSLIDHRWERNWNNAKEITPHWHWQRIDYWDDAPESILAQSPAQSVAKEPWEFVPSLHPRLKEDERHTVEGQLFLENTVQLKDDASLIYLSTHEVHTGWYRFGGEGHLVDIRSHELNAESTISQLLNRPIQRSFALICPGIWGSNKLSYRYPRHDDFPKNRGNTKLLTDRPVPFRYRTQGKLSRGRYGVPAGSVYVFEKPFEKTWWDFPVEWFPKEGFPLKQIGCNLCLPVEIEGVS